MNVLFRLAAAIALLSAATAYAVSPPRVVTAQEVLNKAAVASPELQSARLHSVAAEARIGVARAGFLPTIDAMAMDSTGFPGSTGDLGLTGLPASPYRVGLSGGVSAEIPIWDFGRTWNAVDAAEHDARSEAEKGNYIQCRTYQTALALYYQCSLYHDLREAWTQLAADAKLVRDTTVEFVKTGQRSVVERYLVESEMERANTEVSVNEERERVQIKELGLITGMAPDGIACPSLPAPRQALAFFHGTALGNPIIRQATEAAAAAHSRVDEARADYLPRLLAVANIGFMQDVRLIPDRQIYALGVAVVLPIFEGFRTNNQVAEARALAGGAEKDLESRKLEIADLNAKYDKIIQSTDVALQHLRDEFLLAKQGFDVAKKRYFSLQGTVVDVRDAFQNLSRTQTDYVAQQAAYAQAVGAKAILNGTPF
jgi:outer membrane protein TolC